MADKKEVTVDKKLLQDNFSAMHALYLKSINELHSQMIVDATNATYKGVEFEPTSLEFIFKKCEKCKDEKPESKVESEDLSDDLIKNLMDTIEDTVKNKKPSLKNLAKLVASLDELTRKRK